MPVFSRLTIASRVVCMWPGNHWMAIGRGGGWRGCG
jgi:hypothetical protein